MRSISGWGAILAICVLSLTPSSGLAKPQPVVLPELIPPPPALKSGSIIADMIYSATNPYVRAGEEPSSPQLEFGKTRVAVRMLWSTALYETIIVRIEIATLEDAQLYAYAMPTRVEDAPVVSVHTFLSPAEIRTVVRSIDRFALWDIPESRESSETVHHQGGKDYVSVCADSGGMRIEAFRGAAKHEISREVCGLDEDEPNLPGFARSLTKIAKAHFPDLPTYYFLGH